MSDSGLGPLLTTFCTLLLLSITSACDEDTSGVGDDESRPYVSTPADLCTTLGIAPAAEQHGYDTRGSEDISDPGSLVATSSCSVDLTDLGSEQNQGTLFVALEALEGVEDASMRYSGMTTSPRPLGPTNWELESSSDAREGWWDEGHAETLTRSHPTAQRYERHSHELVIRDDNLVVRIWILEELSKRRKGPEQADALIDEIVEAVHEQVTPAESSR